MNPRVVIDCFPHSAERYRDHYAIVAVDVIRATTTATTALSRGRRVLPVETTDDAFVVAATLDQPLLAGELGGHMPVGFEMNNSPADIDVRTDVHRPMVLVSSSGTQLMLASVGSEAVYLACLRNTSAIISHVAGRYERVAVLGAGTRGQFRREDQAACALVARGLMDRGYVAETRQTEHLAARWTREPVEAVLGAIREGKSAEYLRRSGQSKDLEFVLRHIDDLATVPRLAGGELIDEAASVRETPQGAGVSASGLDSE